MKTFIGLFLISMIIVPSGAYAQKYYNTQTIVGIGVTLEKQADGAATVKFLLPNAPAGRAGLTPGDIIFEVKSMPSSEIVDVRSLSLVEIVALIRGQVGAPVEIWFTRDNSELNHLSILREKIEICENELMIF